MYNDLCLIWHSLFIVLSAHLNGLECVVCRYVKYAIIDLNHVRAGVGDDWTVLYIVGI